MTNEIVQTALKNLKEFTGIQGHWQEKAPLDGELELDVQGQKYVFTTEVKKELRSYHIPQLNNTFKVYKHFIVIAFQLFPKIKEALRKSGIPYLEANGNLFLKKKGLFIFIDTQKVMDKEKNKGNRAFTKTGLKVLFYMLQNTDALTQTHRQLAENTDVGLGNIPQVLDGLKTTGFLIPLRNKSYIWNNKKILLERWVAEYATLLRPKLVKERYKITGAWQELNFNKQKTAWGGEAAADLITHHLRPEKMLIYTRENRTELIKNYKLMPDANGELEVLEMFWKNNESKTVPALLIYADLILEGGKRNTETAKIIYHAYIEPDL